MVQQQNYMYPDLYSDVLPSSQYAVASGSIATVNKSFLRLELYTSKFASKVQVPELRRTAPDSQTRTSVAEYSKAELDELIQEMDGIVQVPNFLKFLMIYLS